MIDAPNLPNLNGLVELANRDGVDIRPTLLRVMTDLYVQKPQHTEQEERHFTELALRLIDLVDAKTRSVVADKIAGYPAAPAAVRHRLLRELISTNDSEPVAAGPARGTAPADELSELFFASSAEERRLILLNLPFAPLPPAAPITPAIAQEATHKLEAAALGHNSELFARELERILAISRTQARRVYEDESGEPIVVVAAALRDARDGPATDFALPQSGDQPVGAEGLRAGRCCTKRSRPTPPCAWSRSGRRAIRPETNARRHACLPPTSRSISTTKSTSAARRPCRSRGPRCPGTSLSNRARPTAPDRSCWLFI